MSFNMVESSKIKTHKELEKERTDAAMSVVRSLERFELSSEFENLTEWQCIKKFLFTANDEILLWFRRKKYYKEITEETGWYEFKYLLLERFGVKDTITKNRLAKWEKKTHESIRDFVERMDDIGIELEIGNRVRHQIIKEQLRNSDIDEEIKAVLHKFHFNEEIRMNHLNQYEDFLRIQNEKRLMNLSKKNQNNNIENSRKVIEFSNKTIEVGNKNYDVIFDTGAFYNFISEDTFNRIGGIRQKCESKNFKTCLGETFTVNFKVSIKFKFEERSFIEEFYILPKRKEHCILIGAKWIAKVHKHNENLIKREIKLIECEINTPPGAKVVEPAYRIPQALEDKVMVALEKLLEKDFVGPSRSSFLNNIRPVEKSDGTIRITCNFIELNKLVELDKYTLPLMEEMTFKLRDQLWFSKIDLKDGFFQIPLKECDRHKTAFRVKNKLYEWKVMPMGFKNSPAIFQRNMDMLFADLIGKACYIYVDDILIFGKNEKEHDENVKKVLEIINNTGLVINKEKSIFKVKEIEFLGNFIKFNEIQPGLKKEQGLNEYPVPKDKEEVRRFMGVVNYYRKFIPNCSTISEPLLRLIRKNVNFEWTTIEDKTFQNLKNLLVSPKILTQPDYTQPFILETDASNVGLGAILSQKFGKEVKPIAFASRKLGDTERNYSITEKEMLAGMWGMENFKYFLYGREFEWITDHKALEVLNTKGTVQSARIERWSDRIYKFKFNVIYKKGEHLGHVDALSRIETTQEFRKLEEINEIVEITEEERKIIRDKHESLVHRGAEIVIDELSKTYDWKNLRSKVKMVVKECIKCKMYNPLRHTGYRFIETFEVGERMGFDIMGPIENRYIIVMIDYFSRKGFGKVLQNRETKGIVNFLEEVYKEIPFRCVVSDNARENISKEVNKWLKEKNINRHNTTAYHHESNGRIERLIRTIREGINKISLKGVLAMRLKRVLEVYNSVKHSALGISPNEACKPENWDNLKRDIFDKRVKNYMKRFKEKSVAELECGQKVLQKNEKYREAKDPKFSETGVVKENLGNKTYLVDRNGKLFKKHLDQLRAISREPVKEGDVTSL